MEVTVLDERYILWNGSKYRRLKPKTTKKYKYKLTVPQKQNRAAYMRGYRRLKKTERLAAEPVVSVEPVVDECPFHL